jgi:hypothetical protein
MNAEELIIGHYEKSLTSEQESHLAALMTSSPEVRGLYEQHGRIHGLMEEDAETVQTSSKLDKVVVGAALGTLVEIAGQGIGFSLLGKVASVIGALAVGGAGIIFYNTVIDKDDADVTPTPAVTQPAPASPQLSAPVDEQPRVDAQTPSATTSTPDVSPTPAETTPSRPSGAPTQNEPAAVEPSTRPGVNFGTDGDTSKIDHGTQVTSQQDSSRR